MRKYGTLISMLGYYAAHTIAKVQYAVCMQAGIYIPDDFLTDVLVAADIMEGGADDARA